MVKCENNVMHVFWCEWLQLSLYGAQRLAMCSTPIILAHRMSIRFAACQVHETVPVQLANPPGTRVYRCSPIFPQPHLMTRVATEVARCPQIGPLVSFQLAPTQGRQKLWCMPCGNVVCCRGQRYASGDVNNNSISSAHRHQLKGMMVLWRRYSLGRTRCSWAIFGV